MMILAMCSKLCPQKKLLMAIEMMVDVDDDDDDIGDV